MQSTARIARPSAPPSLVEQSGGDVASVLERRIPSSPSLTPIEPVRPAEPLSTIDNAAIHEALRCIVEALDLDGATLLESDEGDFRDTYAWWRSGTPALRRMSVRETFPWLFKQLTAGQTICLASADELPHEVDCVSWRGFGLESAVLIPFGVAQRVVGVAAFATTRRARQWCPDTVRRLRQAADLFAGVLARRGSDEALRRALAEVERLTERLRAEPVSLRRDADGRLDTSSVGRSAAIRAVEAQVRQVAATDATVLLLGESGSGKEVFASQIHALSRRCGRAMVPVNCAAIPATLIESELFGREKGAYTGALSRQVGRFEIADGSTIFLDEIGDLPLDLQVKFLRVLENRQFERLGSVKPTKVDTRIIAATHRDLEKRIGEGLFREDLYYRLNVFPIRVPPLRERIEDIPMLVWRFVEEFSVSFGKRVESIGKDNMELLQRYSWPGNVRELRNLVERAVISASGPRLTIALPATSVAGTRRSVKLVDVEREHIKGVLDSTRWRIRGVGGAADQLGLKATTLETRIAKLGLQRPRH